MRQIIRVVVTVVAVMAVAFTAAAQSSDPLFGTWKLNLAKSTYDPGPPPKTPSTVKFEPWEGGIKRTFDSVDAQGKPTHQEGTYKLDGKDYPVKGAAVANTTRAYTKVSNHLEYVNKVNGKVTDAASYMVSQDGKTLAAMHKGTNAQGQTTYTLQIFDRQ